MEKIKVNEEQCIGCGACVAIDPEHFDFNDNGLSNVIKEENLESANLQSAIESCPTGAIKKCDEDECCCEEDCSCGEGCNCDDNCTCGCKDNN